MRIYDVTVPISEVMPVWPGDPRVQIEQTASIAQGDRVNTSRISLSTHTGTHVDAPYHCLPQGRTVDELSPEVLIGPAFVAEVDRLPGNKIEVYDLASLHFPRDTTRLLIKTRNSHYWEDRLSEFEWDYVYLCPKTAEWLVKRGIQLLGVDYLSIDAFGTGQLRAHDTLLGAGVVVVEGLDLSRVPAGRCELMCLPLKIEGGDGAPARVFVIRE